MKNYHTRTNYEILIINLCHSINEDVPYFQKMSNKELLITINGYLMKSNCQRLSQGDITRISRLMNN